MTRSAILAAALILTALPSALQAHTAPPAGETAAAAKVLDAFHSAAARADGEAYFALLGPDAVFLGTDGTERWDKAAFQKFAQPYFAQGKGWTYTPRDRHVKLSRDGRIAWFDEMLDNESYGECRGSGVLEKTDAGWKIVQYNLSVPMPNDLSKELVARIREAKKAPPKP
ncbi:MAG TPA: nuclear transport factor 2 family protein [Thermoanaerobaculia bacterium]|nr:nuclear transport factor 2 family protein [Thermoanaerobaculia bacterium]